MTVSKKIQRKCIEERQHDPQSADFGASEHDLLAINSIEHDFLASEASFWRNKAPNNRELEQLEQPEQLEQLEEFTAQPNLDIMASLIGHEARKATQHQRKKIMSIKYALFPNRLAGEANQYRAVTQINGSQDLESIIRQMMLQGSTVTEADIRAVLTEAIRAATNMLINGQRVNFGGLVQLWPGVSGKFAGKSDYYDRSRHRLAIHTTAGKLMLEEVRRIAEPEKRWRPNRSRFCSTSSTTPPGRKTKP